MDASEHRWAIVLAAGDGTRLRSWTTDPAGRSTPKQYCAFGGSDSLLRWSLDRARRIVPAARVVTVVAERHRRWWTRELAPPFEHGAVVQPENRGTAAGLLLGLLHVLSRDPLARLLVLPADHAVQDEATLHRSLADAVRFLQDDESRVLLLGMTPDAADSEYGWILSRPGAAGRVRPVACFREKPDDALATRLLAQGALLNTFMLAASAARLRELFALSLPALLGAFETALPEGRAWSEAVLRSLYQLVPVRDFSRDVLQPFPDTLRVLAVPPCGWTDLGTPERLLRYLRGRSSGTSIRGMWATPPVQGTR